MVKMPPRATLQETGVLLVSPPVAPLVPFSLSLLMIAFFLTELLQNSGCFTRCLGLVQPSCFDATRRQGQQDIVMALSILNEQGRRGEIPQLHLQNASSFRRPSHGRSIRERRREKRIPLHGGAGHSDLGQSNGLAKYLGLDEQCCSFSGTIPPILLTSWLGGASFVGITSSQSLLKIILAPFSTSKHTYPRHSIIYTRDLIRRSSLGHLFFLLFKFFTCK